VSVQISEQGIRYDLIILRRIVQSEMTVNVLFL